MRTGILLNESKYGGTCDACESPYSRGDKVEWYGKGGPSYHFDCRPRHIPKFEQEGFVFIDFETGGTDPEVNALTQVGSIVTDCQFRTRSYFSSYIKPFPGSRFEDKAMEITGITPEMLRDKPTEEMVALALHEQLSQYPGLRFSGFNTDFDRNCMVQLSKRTGIDLDSLYLYEPPLDLYPISKALFDLDRYKLVDIQEHLGQSTEGAHDAFVDIGNTVVVARKVWSLINV